MIVSKQELFKNLQIGETHPPTQLPIFDEDFDIRTIFENYMENEEWRKISSIPKVYEEIEWKW